MLFLVPALSLAGIPPLSGFFAKLSLVKAGLNAEQYAIAGTALVVGLLTLFSMTKIWAEAFWKPMPTEPVAETELSLLTPLQTRRLLMPIGALAVLTVVIGLGAELVFTLATSAAEQLLHREGYIQAVMGGGTP